MANFAKLLKSLVSKKPKSLKSKDLENSITKVLKSDIPLTPEEIAAAEKNIKDLENERLMQQWLREVKAPRDIIAETNEARIAPRRSSLEETSRIKELSGFKNWEEGGPTSQALKEQAKKEFELGKEEGVKDIDLQKYWNTLESEKKTEDVMSEAKKTALGRLQSMGRKKK